MKFHRIPNHIAIIPDGNRRWALENNLPSVEGHKRGLEKFIEIAKASREMGIHTLTGWAFSSENWKRDIAEINYIMELFVHGLRKTEEDAHKDNARIVHLGRKDRLPEKLRTELARIESDTKKYEKFCVNICIDYGGRDELVRAINKILSNDKKIDSISKEDFEKFLDTSGQKYPNVDLVIRTSGEQRLSGFLPWQVEYAEFYFEKDPMPEFSVQKLEKALQEYDNRERRFGGNTNK